MSKFSLALRSKLSTRAMVQIVLVAFILFAVATTWSIFEVISLADKVTQVQKRENENQQDQISSNTQQIRSLVCYTVGLVPIPPNGKHEGSVSAGLRKKYHCPPLGVKFHDPQQGAPTLPSPTATSGS